RSVASSAEYSTAVDLVFLFLDLTRQRHRIQGGMQGLQLLLLWGAYFAGVQDARIGRLRVSILANGAVAFAPLAAELLRGQEVMEDLSQSAFAEGVDERHSGRIVVTLVAEMLAHMGVVSLFHMRIVVAFIGARPGEAKRAWADLGVAHQVMVDKLSAVIR